MIYGLHFLLGCLAGAGVIGSSVARTIAVEQGNMGLTFKSSIVNAAAYFCSVKFVASDDYAAYAGSVTGGTLMVMYMARKAKNEKKFDGLKNNGDA